MPKVILEFDPHEDKYEMESALHATKFRLALSEIDRKLRDIVKYGENVSDEVDQLCHDVRKIVWEAFEGVEG